MLEVCGFETNLCLVVLTCWMFGRLGKVERLGRREMVG